jgi:hypothetical protein
MPKRRANGEGSEPYKRYDGRWQAIYTYTAQDGQLKRGSVSAKTSCHYAWFNKIYGLLSTCVTSCLALCSCHNMGNLL